MDKFQSFYVEKQQTSRTTKVQSMLYTPEQSSNLVTERMTSKMNALSNFSRHKAGKSEMRPSVTKTVKPSGLMTVKHETNKTADQQKNKFIVGSLDKFNEMQQKLRLDKQQQVVSDFHSSIDRIASSLSQNDNITTEQLIQGKEKVFQKQKYTALTSKIPQLTSITSIPKLPILNSISARQGQFIDGTSTRSPRSPRNGKQKISNRHFGGLKNTMNLNESLETGETVLQLPSKRHGANLQNQLQNRKKQQSKMETKDVENEILILQDSSILRHHMTEQSHGQRQDSVSSGRDSLVRDINQNSQLNTYGVPLNSTHSNLEKLDQVQKVYRDQKIMPIHNQSIRSKHHNTVKNIGLVEASASRSKHQVDSSFSQHSNSNINDTSQTQNRIKTGSIQLARKIVTEDKKQLKTSIHTVTTDKNNLLAAKQGSKDNNGGQYLPAVSAVYGGEAKTMESDYVSRNYSTTKNRGVIGDITFPRKYSQVVPPSYQSSALKGSLSVYSRKESNSSSVANNHNQYKQISQKKSATKVYLNQNNIIQPPQGNSTLISTADKVAINKRNQQMKIDAQVYPVSNSNLQKSFKPMTLATRRMNVAHQGSNLSAKYDKSEDSQENSKSVTNSRANHPYHENHDATAKALDPAQLERSSIKLPDLMPDNKSKMHMAINQQSQQQPYTCMSTGSVKNDPAIIDYNNRSMGKSHYRKTSGLSNINKSFESSVGSCRGLVQPTFIPVLDEKKEQKKRSLAIKNNSLSRDEIQQSESFKTVDKKLPDTPFVELNSMMGASSMPTSPKIQNRKQSVRKEAQAGFSKQTPQKRIEENKKEKNILHVETQMNDIGKIEIVDDLSAEDVQPEQSESPSLKLSQFEEQSKESNIIIQPIQQQRQDSEKYRPKQKKSQNPLSKENMTTGQQTTTNPRKDSINTYKQPFNINQNSQSQMKRSTSGKRNKNSIGVAHSKEQESIQREPSISTMRPAKLQYAQTSKTSKRRLSIGESKNDEEFSQVKNQLNQKSEEKSPTKVSQRNGSPTKGKYNQIMLERHAVLTKAYIDSDVLVKNNIKSRQQQTKESQNTRDNDQKKRPQVEVNSQHADSAQQVKARAFLAEQKSEIQKTNRAITKKMAEAYMDKTQASQRTSSHPAPVQGQKVVIQQKKADIPHNIKSTQGNTHLQTQSQTPNDKNSIFGGRKSDQQSRDKFVTMRDTNKTNVTNKVVLNKDLVLLDQSSPPRHGSLTRLQEQQSQELMTENTKRDHTTSTIVKNNGMTPKTKLVSAHLERAQKAKQFDKQRRQLEKIEVRQQNSSSLTLNKQTTQGSQEAKTKGMLRMMDSTASLTKLEAANGAHESNIMTPSGVGNFTKQSHRQKPKNKNLKQKANQKKFSLADFEMLSNLGTGSFGNVRLLKHKRSGELYALKQIQKERIIGDKHIQHVQNEKSILKDITSQPMNSPRSGGFFVNFIESMQDEQNLYLLLEYLPGGELLKQIKEQLSLTLEDSIFYLAEVLVAIQQLHERNIIYRDLKPENILLDRHGHIKLIDFGFAKQVNNLRNHKARTNCGTPAYAAPEVVIGTGYGYKADIWSFGILICEILGGFTPFGPKAMEIGVAQDHGFDDRPSAGIASMPPQQIIEMVNSGRIILPKNLTPVTRDIVRKILVADPNVRLEIRDIMQHKFFEGVDWQKVSRKQNQPPYVPDTDDTSHLMNHMEQQGSMEKLTGAYANDLTSGSSAAQANSLISQPHKQKVGSNMNIKSSPYTKRTNPNKILGDFQMTKLNQAFEDF